MTRRTIHILIALVVGLVLLLVVLQNTERSDVVTGERPLFPDFRAVANEVSRVRVARQTGSEGVTIRREDDQWIVSGRDAYPADVGKLRKLIIALADARILEEKTADPEQYHKLGVEDPAKGGDGPTVIVDGPNFSYSLILGNEAHRDYRFVRIVEDATSYLIDQNPDVPQSAGDWLMPDIIDLESSRVRRVTLAHADGETIVIEKSEQAQTDFDVADIPEGRELSYATVGNGIARALTGLTLEDVRKAVEQTPDTTIEFETWDGLRVTVEAAAGEDTTWFAFAAEALPRQPASEAAVEEAVSGDTAPDAADEDSVSGSDADTTADEAASLNERLSGWQYELAEHKKNQLTRRWEDILKSVETE